MKEYERCIKFYTKKILSDNWTMPVGSMEGLKLAFDAYQPDEEDQEEFGKWVEAQMLHRLWKQAKDWVGESETL